jgi:hypothetical protein
MAIVEVATPPPAGTLPDVLPPISAIPTEAPPADASSSAPPPAEQPATDSKSVEVSAPADPNAPTRAMSRDLSLSDLDIPIPSASDIGKRKGPTPPPTPPPEVVKEPAKHPPGVLSIFVTDPTCERIGLYKEGAKHESLHLVSAKKIMEEIETKGKASEFFKLKGQLKVLISQPCPYSRLLYFC